MSWNEDEMGKVGRGWKSFVLKAQVFILHPRDQLIFFCDRPDTKYFHLCRPDLCCNYSVLTRWHRAAVGNV